MRSHSPAANRYRETAIRTATPLQLVVILYEGVIQALQEAQEHLQRGNIAARSRCVNQAIAMISELQASLNFSEGGKIAQSLNSLYDYMKRKIFSGNLQQCAEPLAEVVTLLDGLRSAWQQLANQTPATASGTSKPMALSQEAWPASGSNSLNISG